MSKNHNIPQPDNLDTNSAQSCIKYSKAMYSQDGIYFKVKEQAADDGILGKQEPWDDKLEKTMNNACETSPGMICIHYNGLLKSRDEQARKGSNVLLNKMVNELNKRFPKLADSCKPNSSTEEFVGIHNQMSRSIQAYRTQNHDSLYLFV